MSASVESQLQGTYRRWDGGLGLELEGLLSRVLVLASALALRRALPNRHREPALKRALVPGVAMERALVRVLALVVRRLPSGRWLVLPARTSKLARTLVWGLAMERALVRVLAMVVRQLPSAS